MKKTFQLENLDCAHCAAKMAEAINKLDKVKEADIAFMTQKLTIEAEEEDFDSILKDAQEAIKKVERGCKIVV